MNCARCQHDNRPAARFCEECGTRLARACASCGAELSPTAKFCPECGQAADREALPAPPRLARPDTYTPGHLAEKILLSKAALEGERKHVTVLFADLKGSMELLADRDPEEARRILDPVLERMMEAVHRYEGTVNQVMGDGIMALFGAPLAHEDHAVRACYAALRMQDSVKRHAADLQRAEGIPIAIRIGLNSGEVVVRAIGSDLHMDYTAVGQTTHLAARMEQAAMPGSILVSSETLRLAEGYVRVTPLGPTRIKGLEAPVDVYEVIGAGATRTRLQVSAARGLTRFVGRDAELDHCWTALERVREGRGQVLALIGEPGVGKSRLTHELTHSHRTHGWLVLPVAAMSHGQATLYVSVIELLCVYLGIHEHDDARAIRERVTGKVLTLDAALAETIPPLLALLDGLPEDNPFFALDPGERRRRTLDALRRLLLREARVQPVLVVVEDLQWVDAETQALLDTLVDGLASAPLGLLVNYRPEYRHDWGNRAYYTQLRLEPLSTGGAAELVAALVGTDRELAPLEQQLIARTGGNPFFLEESVRSMVETGVLVGERGAYRLARAGETIPVPATVQAVLAARIDRLDPGDKALLQAAAVIGKDVAVPLLRATAGETDETLRPRLARLQAAEFLYETSTFPLAEYTFVHALTQEVAYGGLLHERRRALHARALDALIATAANGTHEHAEQLAHHAVRAEQWERAAVYLHQAGEKVFSYGVHAPAAPFFEAAIDAVDRQGAAGNRTLKLDACIELWAVSMETGRLDRVPELAATAESLAISLEDWPRLAKIRVTQAQGLWGFPQTAGAVRHAIERAREAFRLADRSDIRTRSYARFVAASALRETGDLRDSVAEYDHGIAEFDGVELTPAMQAFARPILASLWSWRADALAALGDFERAVASGQEGLRVADEIGHPSIRAMAHASLGFVHATRGDIEPARQVLEAGLAIVEELNVAYSIAKNGIRLALAHALLGERGPAIRQLDRARATVASLGTVRLKFTDYGSLVALTLLALDRLDDARQEVDEGLALAAEHGARGHEPSLLRLRAEILAGQAPDDLEPAFRCAEAALARAREHGMRPLVADCHFTLGKLHDRAGAREHARAEIGTAMALYREMGMRFWVERARIAMSEPARP
jgi:class 3 adenylate cyclase/tetratricopeptide (TPR) repeat protein